jgi:hypothetical protein
MEFSSMKKVLCPVENKKTGHTYWMRVGTAFLNRDGSTQVKLDAYPTNGTLQIRDLDASDIERMTQRRQAAAAASPPAAAPPADELAFPPRTTAFGL